METIIFKTLMHSIWQGLVLAALTTLVMLFTRNATSALRYKWLTACLFLFSAGTVATLVININAAPASDVVIVQTTGNVVRQIKQAPEITSSLRNNFVQMLNYLDAHASLIVWFWMLIIFGKSIQMAIGLRKVNFLRKNEVYHAGNYWEERLEALCTKFNIHQKVQIMQSGIAKAPLVAGHFKPLILIPLGLMNNLTTAEVEAIISHELAHIRRKDYLVNMLQSFLEIIFFFNPAVIWINGLIREERENCCDDLSLSANVRLKDYISALVSCTELAQQHDKFALGFAGQKGQLMNRVNRMVYKKRMPVNGTQKLMLVALLFAVQLCTAALSMPEAINKNGLLQDKKPAKKTTTTTKQSSSLTVTQKDTVDAKKEALKRLQREKASAAIAQQKMRTVSQNKRTSTYIDKQAEYQEKHSKYIDDRKVADDKTARAEQKELELRRLQAERDKKAAAIAKEREDNGLKAYEKAEEFRKQATQGKGPKRFTEEDSKALHNELYTAGLIKNQNKTSYILNNTELIVDGVKQPESVRKKFADKYIIPGMSIVHDYDFNTTTITTP